MAVRQVVRRATSVPTAGTSSGASCCTAGSRTRSRSTPCAGWCSRRTTRCADAAGTGSEPAPHGVVELTPEREYLLLTEFFDGAVELGDVDVDDEIIDSGLAIVRRLWDAGLAHRDIKPSNLLVRDGEVLLIDVAFAELRPTPWRQAVDLANMMLCLALRSSPERVYQRALRSFHARRIGEAFAAARGLALPVAAAAGAARPGTRPARRVRRAAPPAPPDPDPAVEHPPRRPVGGPGAPCGGWHSQRPLRVRRLVRRRAGHRDVAPHRQPRTAVPTWSRCGSRPKRCRRPAGALPFPLPAGWTVANVAVNDGRSLVTLNHDQAGTGAVEMRLSAACDLAGTVEMSIRAAGRAALPTDRAAHAGGLLRRLVRPIRRWLRDFPARTQRPTSRDASPTNCPTCRLHQPAGARQRPKTRSRGRLHLDPERRT